jgi:NADH-quinone oxidoreductase subunit F
MRVLTEGLEDGHDLVELDAYRAAGGYEALAKALREMKPAEVAAEVSASNLRGRGGAGFPAGRKWSFLPNDGRPRYLCINGDESEPGSFSNRDLIELNPHLVIEGTLCAGYAIGAAGAFIYLRGEFYEGARILQQAIEAARAAGLCGANILGSGFSLDVVVHRGAGAYICGEETALLESLEGKRGHPRVRPPFPAVAGLYAMPTVVNNVETIANVPAIIRHGSAWFKSLGPEKSPGTKVCSVSGHVMRPGNYELVMGTPLRELIFEHAGGLRPGRSLRMVLPAGASSVPLLAEHLDVPLDFDSMAAAGSMLGSAGLIVLDDTACPVRTAYVADRFFAHESCGKCTPCREGTTWLRKILERLETGHGRPEDVALLDSLCEEIGGGKCLCPLGDFSVAFLRRALRAFHDDFERHVTEAGCPAAAAEVRIA